MSADDYWSLPLRSVLNVIEGRREGEEARERAEWERTRWMAATYLQPHLKKNAKMKLTDLIEFPWEVKAPAAPIKQKPAIWEQWDEEMKRTWQG